jgi:hypothetical protein
MRARQKAAHMFLIAIRDGEEEKLHYWSGGEAWSANQEDAARFIQEADANATIDLLKKVIPVSPTVHVVPVAIIEGAPC